MEHAPPGVQVLALGYSTGEAWNETACSDPEFDRKLHAALAMADAVKRNRHARPYVKGFEIHPLLQIDRENTWLDR